MSTQTQRPSEDATQAGVFPVVEPGHTFATITEKINHRVVTSRRSTPPCLSVSVGKLFLRHTLR